MPRDGVKDDRTRLTEELTGPITTALIKVRGLVCPQIQAIEHPSTPLLHKYAATGCPLDMQDNWTRTQLEAAVQRGPHVSALEPDAIA